MKTIDEIKNATHFIVKQVSSDGGQGVITYGKMIGSVIWSNGCGWEHVSVAPYKHSYIPTWEDMCKLKSMFFYDDEWVVQFHPPKSQYVNNMPNCLHLWRPIYVPLPVPPSVLVGIRKGQTQEEFLKELDELYSVADGNYP